MRWFLPGCLAVVLIPALCTADAYPRRKGVDVLHYQFRISLVETSEEIEGEARIKVRFADAGVKNLELDLAFPSDAGGMMVSEVRSGGSRNTFTHGPDLLVVNLATPTMAGEQREILIKYSGKPADGFRSVRNRSANRFRFAENWPDKTHHWLPVIDHPSDKATSEFFVTAPAQDQVIGNGKLLEQTDLKDGRRLTHWSQSVPIPVWQNVIVVGKFAAIPAEKVGDVPLQCWVYPEDRDRAPALGEVMRQSLLFFAETVGPYPYEKLDAVELGIGFGGLENASLIYFSDRAIFRPDRASLVAHEVAHQWFGNSVTEADWDDAWLSEGFATYFSMLFLEHQKGAAALRQDLARSRDIVLDAQERAPGGSVIHENPTDLSQVIEPLVYHKGAWTLHMLRGMVGPDAFREGVRAYYRDHRDGNATTEDFRHAIEQFAKTDLSWFFAQWLKRPGIPSIVGEWSYDPMGKMVIVDLDQVQAGEPYRMPIEIGLTENGGNAVRLERSEMTGRKLQLKFPSERVPVSVVLDPNGWILMRSRFGNRQALPSDQPGGELKIRPR